MSLDRRGAYDRVLERRRAVALAQHYRYAEGLSIAQIADRLGRSPATIKAYFYDPTGDKARAVKARYVGLYRGCGAYTHGRRSYEFFGARWRPRSGQLADRLNSMPKYVVSSTLEDPEWNNSTILKGDVVTEVSKLKQELDGEIVVPGSYQLGRKLS